MDVQQKKTDKIKAPPPSTAASAIGGMAASAAAAIGGGAAAVVSSSVAASVKQAKDQLASSSVSLDQSTVSIHPSLVLCCTRTVHC